MSITSIENFRNRFVKNGKRKDCKDREIAIFQQGRTIFFISAKSNTLITKPIKEKLEREFCDLKGNKVFVSIFETKKKFIGSSEKIAWGTYVWFQSEPKHFIHYDDKPVLKPRHI